jgi:ribosome-binding factor A
MAKHQRSRDDVRDAGFRSLRLELLFREELNSILGDEIADPRLTGVWVSAVELSRDGSRARIWFIPNPSTPPTETRGAFNRASGFLRSRLCDALVLKRVPELSFRHDEHALHDHQR